MQVYCDPYMSTQMHVHERKGFFPERYMGEKSGQIVVEWLNSHHDKRDPLRRLLQASGDFRAGGFAPFEAGEKVNAILRDVLYGARLAVAPQIVEATAIRWTLDWRPVGRMKRDRALAFFKLLQLAEQGLLGRVRQCAKPGCKKWFFAVREHQRFDSTECQVEDFRSSPEWRAKRRDYMRRLRVKEREEREVQKNKRRR